MDGVHGAYDLVLNDFGPQRLWGSVHIEVDDTLSAAQIDELSRKIESAVYEKHQVILHTVGVYSTNTDEKTSALRNEIYTMIKKHPEVIEIHGFYLKPETNEISMDIIISLEAEDRHALHQTVNSELSEVYSDYQFNITLDSDISD
jgi:divalent metal cation (Fe/Co/Zn/Cd) transporter